jgi:hypothetical protein
MAAILVRCLALLCVVSRIAVFGGVYANPYALDAVLADARGRGCEQRFCLGDLGGFGADCDGVWPRLLDAGVRCIAGNYDVAIGRGDEDCGCGYADERDNRFAQVMAGRERLVLQSSIDGARPETHAAGAARARGRRRSTGCGLAASL